KRKRPASMDTLYSLDSHSAPTQQTDCCETSGCCNLPIVECMDEQCQILMNDYCQVCLDHQTCEVEGCTLGCDECCNDTNCMDGYHSCVQTQVLIKPVKMRLTIGELFAASWRV